MIQSKNFNRPLDLVLLKTFVQVVDSKGFTAASEQLNLAQSTVSVHIKRLENIVGYPLLEKRQHDPKPTVVGERVLLYARRLLQLNTLAWQDIYEERIKGIVRLGIPDDYLVYLPKVLGEFERKFPDVELQVYCGLSVELLEMINTQQLDVAVTTRQPNTPGGEVLSKERTVWAGALTYDIADRSPLPLAISRDPQCVFRKRAIEALNAADIAWRIAYTSTSLSGLTAAVTAGLAVTILTPSMITPNVRILGEEDGLPELPFTEIALHLQAENTLNEATKRLANAIRRAIKA